MQCPSISFSLPLNKCDPTFPLSSPSPKLSHNNRELRCNIVHIFDQITHRNVEPYGIIGWNGHWYLVGYCCLRKDYRTFRLDHIQQATMLTENFERPEDFDCRSYVMKQQYGGFPIEVEFQAPLFTVQQRIPASYGTFTVTPTGILFQTHYESIEGMARYLMSLNIPFVIHQPTELRETLLSLAEQMVRIAQA
ncbi:MAG TPA: hypothetical protein DHW02_05580 [Ktedonobacter sp.]|nr:hypothetical protein [Ktedonobacter sp.]